MIKEIRPGDGNISTLQKLRTLLVTFTYNKFVVNSYE